jgi:hypothetical protein
MKVVINKCFGGFGLSEQGVMRYAEIKGITLYPEPDKFGFVTYWTVPPHKRPRDRSHEWSTLTMEERRESNRQHENSHLYDRDIPRDDPVLVQVVEELGEKADGRHASLKVVEIPDGVSYEIAEYDGSEHIAETHRTWE